VIILALHGFVHQSHIIADVVFQTFGLATLW